MRNERILLLIATATVVVIALVGWRWAYASERITWAVYDGIHAGMTEAEVVEWVGISPGDYRLYEPNGFVCWSGAQVEQLGPPDADVRMVYWKGPHGLIGVAFDQAGRANGKGCHF